MVAVAVVEVGPDLVVLQVELESVLQDELEVLLVGVEAVPLEEVGTESVGLAVAVAVAVEVVAARLAGIELVVLVVDQLVGRDVVA